MLQKEIEEYLGSIWKRADNQRQVYYRTGKGGAIQHQEQLLGRALTVAEKAKLKDGVYEISTKNGLKYLGWYDSEMKDGVYAFKSNDGVYSVEAFRNHWRTHYKEITKSEFEEITKGKQAI